jgi:hypothetical protein
VILGREDSRRLTHPSIASAGRGADHQARRVNAEPWNTGLSTSSNIAAERATDLNSRFDVPGFTGYIQEAGRQASVAARFD